jgi:hypothetical protein
MLTYHTLTSISQWARVLACTVIGFCAIDFICYAVSGEVFGESAIYTLSAGLEGFDLTNAKGLVFAGSSINVKNPMSIASCKDFRGRSLLAAQRPRASRGASFFWRLFEMFAHREKVRAWRDFWRLALGSFKNWTLVYKSRIRSTHMAIGLFKTCFRTRCRFG